ncbi:hypothetical protein L211DRAFT_408438 [Terfezia boudieri ATCC MYA-4762]|uniref:Uncharacterized protein n=1 Tax=Terfezia boudieri ATCC MYA-4762 TaxID=1051890 RepID=A0A3N4LJH1_9PEZI|nr:hypothetical protein L211DRAFT_408438 [Terfezia boudieri ATCC MYA-4762]
MGIGSEGWRAYGMKLGWTVFLVLLVLVLDSLLSHRLSHGEFCFCYGGGLFTIRVSFFLVLCTHLCVIFVKVFGYTFLPHFSLYNLFPSPLTVSPIFYGLVSAVLEGWVLGVGSINTGFNAF